ncbi:exonuclease 1-like [Ruditapes philippinarum]|uniref:exonuclease 1-like n=1 Tax=Ruditapes philippinarum TaxID=129788 RepID=UPI00295B8CB8|nr:exonuclease 1-like [Ruditapes philippinarum]
MGIQGLLPFLKKIHEPVNVAQFAGCTVAIDAYCWLHKGAFSCAEKLALGEKTDQYVYYCMKYINYMLSKNIKPVMVFDGCHLPSKKNVEKSRREKRELNKKKAAQFLREGKRAEARECLQRCIDITPEMALELMNTCRDRGVDCIVAPYEADAQLAYLNKIGVAQVIITEDSDLLLFGCEKVLFKMDHAGNGILIERKRLNEVTDIQSGHYLFDKFRYMCILSGCDYLPSLSGIGLARANKVFKIARQADIKQLLKKLPTYLKSSISVPQEYIDGFVAANNTFLYQFVYDPLQRRLVPLNPYPQDVNPDELSYAGSPFPAKKALQIALGNVNIYSGEIFASFDPETFVPKYVKKKPQMLHMLSIWDKNYRVKPRVPLHETQVADRPNLKGKEITVKANLKKRSPHKRVREVEDAQEVKSNTELYDMYHSPVKKRARVANIDRNDDEEKPEEEFKPDPKNSPRFFNSLSEAHPEVKVESENETDNDVDQENIVSPRRNIFASKSPSKRPRFNLNAPKPKQLKSRFFANNSISKTEDSAFSKGESGKSSPKNEGLSSLYKPVHSNTANVYSSVTHHASNDSEVAQDPKKDLEKQASDESDLSSVSITEVSKHHFKFSDAKGNNSPKSSPKGGSAFKWSKFKFNRTSSTDSLSVSHKNSKEVKNPFKKVVYSNQPNRKQLMIKGGNSESQTVVLIDSDEDSTCGLQIPAPFPRTEKIGVSSATNKGKTKSGCRVSGLSKRSKKSSSSQDTSNKQHNLKDMFAKFAHNKSEKPRLNHDTIDCDKDDAFTPETKSYPTSKNTSVQRVLMK